MVNGNRELKSHARRIQQSEDVPYTVALSTAQIREEQPVFQLGEHNGVKMQATISDETFPFKKETLPVYGRIELPDGTLILAFDYGQMGEFTFSDGTIAKSYVHPMYQPSPDGIAYMDEEDAEHLITGAQFEALVKADAFADDFFPEGMGMTEQEADQLTLAQLAQMVRERIAKGI